MSEHLCSKIYQDFFQSLPEDGISPIELLQHIRETIIPVAQTLYIGHLELSLQSPATYYEQMGRHEAFIIYTEDNYDEYSTSQHHLTGGNGHAFLAAHPVSNYTWSSDEENEVQFLLKNLYFLIGRSRIMDMMDKIVTTDNLTGLPNASSLTKYCNMLFTQGNFSNYTGLFINLKSFKYVNQRIGSSMGDLLLREYAKHIHAMMTPQELYCRLGGDNFFALLLNEHVQDFLQKTNIVSITLNINNRPTTFDISANIGIYPIQSTSTVSDMMTGSSIAMSLAKQSVTGNVVWFTPAMLTETIRKKEIISQLPHALQKREFVVYYQPKIDLSDNSLCGCEALVRWYRDGKLVPPLDFIPILEQDSSICSLDFYVLETVCMDIRNWLNAGITPVRTSVNFSKIHLHNKNLSQDVLDILQKYQLDGKYIEIEITETSGYEDFTTLSDFVNEMKKHGIKISLDDFGIGYSSLTLLKDLNVDIIKLDKSFLQNVSAPDPSNDVVIHAIVNMVHALNMQVIAEGVETSVQASYLRNINCHLAQGFLFDMPLTKTDFEKCLTGERLYDANL